MVAGDASWSWIASKTCFFTCAQTHKTFFRHNYHLAATRPLQMPPKMSRHFQWNPKAQLSNFRLGWSYFTLVDLAEKSFTAPVPPLLLATATTMHQPPIPMRGYWLYRLARSHLLFFFSKTFFKSSKNIFIQFLFFWILRAHI